MKKFSTKNHETSLQQNKNSNSAKNTFSLNSFYNRDTKNYGLSEIIRYKIVYKKRIKNCSHATSPLYIYKDKSSTVRNLIKSNLIIQDYTLGILNFDIYSKLNKGSYSS